MPARVHALLFVRADLIVDAHLSRTLDAISAQRRPVDALTIVSAGELRPGTRRLIEASGAEGVIATGRALRFAPAMDLAARRVAADADAIWLLAADTAPAPEALERLDGALEVQPLLAVAAPKLVAWDDPATIVSLGVTMTRFGRTVGLADGEHDQGQHDTDSDVLGADVRGILVRRDAWVSLGGDSSGLLDAGLHGADEGLDVGVRARLADRRVAVVPSARIAVAGDGAAGAPAPTDAGRRRRARAASRTAQLHRRLAYAPAWAVPLHWLSIPVLAVWNSLLALVRKNPAAIAPEWAAAARVWIGVGAVSRARARIRRAVAGADLRARWAQLAPLRADRRRLRDRLALDVIEAEPDVRGALRFFSGGGAWAVLAFALIGVVAFFPLIAWPVLGGGALQPLRSALSALWLDAAAGQRPLGWDLAGPADPFSAVIALLGSLTPWHPSQSLVVLWVLALPLAALAGWFGASRLSEKAGARIAGAALWALAPPFVAALVEGRPAAVIAHLLLPWLLITLAAAHRSIAAASAAALLLAATLACAPSLAPVLAVVVVIAFFAARRGAWRVAGVVVPTIALFAPLVWVRGVIGGDWIALLADPGVLAESNLAPATIAGRLAQVVGSPLATVAGWSGTLATWAWVLVVPLAVLALLGLLTRRIVTTVALAALAVLALVAAFVAAGIRVGMIADGPVALWTGSLLSLAWAGATGAVIVAIDARAPRSVGAARAVLATVAVAAVAALATPGLATVAGGTSALTNGPRTTLPAFVATAARDDGDRGTLVLRAVGGADNAGAVSASVVWGGSETLGAQTTLLTAPGTDAGSASLTAEFAAVVADLVSGATTPGTPDLAAHGIAFVLLEPPRAGAPEAARSLAAQASAALDARGSLEAVGDTPPGRLWKVSGDIAPRAPETAAESAISLTIGVVQIAVCAIALLLAVPTASSRRSARRYPRVIGASRTARADAAPREREPLVDDGDIGDDLDGGSGDDRGGSTREGAFS